MEGVPWSLGQLNRSDDLCWPCFLRHVAAHCKACGCMLPVPTGMEEHERPWLKPHVSTPAARDVQKGATRKRPLIYVYELPAMFNALMLSVGAPHCLTVAQL